MSVPTRWIRVTIEMEEPCVPGEARDATVAEIEAWADRGAALTFQPRSYSVAVEEYEAPET